jgi:hypothetical protein
LNAAHQFGCQIGRINTAEIRNSSVKTQDKLVWNGATGNTGV